MGHFLKIKCIDSRVNVHILVSTGFPFTLTISTNSNEMDNSVLKRHKGNLLHCHTYYTEPISHRNPPFPNFCQLITNRELDDDTFGNFLRRFALPLPSSMLARILRCNHLTPQIPPFPSFHQLIHTHRQIMII
jgi:hypothetical protein